VGVEFCHEVAVGGSGGGEFVVAVLKFLVEVEDLLLELTELGSKLFGFVAAPDAAVSEDFVAEGFGEPAVEFGVLASEAFVLVAEVGEVGVQRSLADRRGGRAGVGCFGAGDDSGAQVVVAVEEDRSTRAARATEETVSSSPAAASSSSVARTRWRRWVLSRRRAAISGSGEGGLVMRALRSEWQAVG
jgi:hypothetical protein